MEKLIYLYWKDINLLSLSYENQQYIQNVNIDNLKSALSTGCPIQLLFNKEIEKTIVTKYLPIIFDEFNFSNARTDLLTSYDITPEDSVFDKLYKIAQKSEKTTHDGFWISVN